MKSLQLYLNDLCSTLNSLNTNVLKEIADVLHCVRKSGGTVFTCGNGGSMATASHFACDLAKGTINAVHRRFRVVCLCDSLPLLTAWANDTSYSNVFREQIISLGQPHDALILISGSGNSENIIQAALAAADIGMKTVGLIGFSGGRLSDLVDIPLVISSNSMEQAEDIHLAICHAIALELRSGYRHEA